MALRLIDSFDHYDDATELGQKWTGTANTPLVQAASARTGARGLAFDNDVSYVYVTLTAQNTWIVGAAVKLTGTDASSRVLVGILDGGIASANKQLDLRVLSDGRLQITRAGAIGLATSTLTLSLNTWYYVECKVVIANAGGTAEIHVNGVEWATFTGDTQATANATASVIMIGRDADAAPNLGADQISFDDIFICDGSGGTNNTFLGDVQVDAIFPDGVGFYTEWDTVFGAAAHWQAVDETTPDEDTTYIESTTVNDRDTFTYQDVGSGVTGIKGIQVVIRAKKVDASAVNIRRLHRSSGGVDSEGADIAPSTAYTFHREILETNPDGGAAWTPTSLNGSEFGAKIV